MGVGAVGVAPRAGARIETLGVRPSLEQYPQVAPRAGRGLKLQAVKSWKVYTEVAPHAGAWIETIPFRPKFVGRWTIPARRMKSKCDRRVQLCGWAMAILKAARQLGDGCRPLVFPGQRGTPISITRLPRLLQNVKVAAVPRGFRSSFRDWAAEETDYLREVVEAALATWSGTRRKRRMRDRTCLSAAAD